MSYITKMKAEINSDIKFCEELLNKDFVEGKEFSNLIGKYRTIYPNFECGLKNFAISVGGKVNQIENVRIIKSKLELLLIDIQNPIHYKESSKSSVVNVNNSSNNSNTNNVTINLSIEEIRKEIDENTILGDKEKEELLEKLEEVEKLQKSNESKSKKWAIAKGILGFILDKGADIAIMFIPQILKAIQ